MGYTSAMGMAEAASLEVGLTWHLQSNHYPPVPVTMVPVCVAAIAEVQNGNGEEWIDLPDGIAWRGQDEVPAHVVVTDLHLEPWL